MEKISIMINNWFEKTIQPILRKMVGLEEFFSEPLERIETIEYILNHSLDITKMVKASGEQRQMQLVGAEVLRLVHEMCCKNNLTYWIDWGTLLGAVRHGGYVPWDDDLDISMPIEDFRKAMIILPEALKEYEKYGIGCSVTSNDVMAVTLWKAGVMLDIVATDNTCFSLKDELVINYKKLIEYNRKHLNLTISEKEKIKYEIMGKNDTNNPIWYQPGYNNMPAVFETKVLFPTKTIKFEGYDFCAPNNIEEYLRICYGDYMSFPKTGVLKHHGGKGKPLHCNITKYHVNANALLAQLRSIIA